MSKLLCAKFVIDIVHSTKRSCIKSKYFRRIRDSERNAKLFIKKDTRIGLSSVQYSIVCSIGKEVNLVWGYQPLEIKTMS